MYQTAQNWGPVANQSFSNEIVNMRYDNKQQLLARQRKNSSNLDLEEESVDIGQISLVSGPQ